MGKQLLFIANKSEIGDGKPGASLGIDALHVAGLKLGSDLLKSLPMVTVAHENELLYKEVKVPFAKRIDAVERLYKRMVNAIQPLDFDRQMPIVLAGDHASAGGTIAGIKARMPGATLGVIWIDAHADIHSPFTTPSGNMHGMPVAAALGWDHLEKRINEVSQAGIDGWEKLKAVGGIQPKIQPQHLCYIGLRDIERQEEEVIAEHDVLNISIQSLRRNGLHKVIKALENQLSDCDLIYVSFDVDSLDPAISPGTGTPVQGGFLLEEARELLLGVMALPKVCCLEVAEINPVLDQGNQMAEAAFSLLHSVVKFLQK